MNKVFFFFFLVGVGFSQTKEEVLRDAKITSKATLNSDFKTVFKHTYPPIIKLMGGEDTALSLVKGAFDSMKEQGLSFEKADVISVSKIIEEQGQYRCYVENNYEMKMPGVKIISKSYLLGIYDKDKKIWYFLEADKLKNSSLVDQILPDFKTSLNIPENDMKTEKI
tara:strand:+ start:56613 stop:57113 length:501 start_codon:yes stop_codon:yes gene_type:complete